MSQIPETGPIAIILVSTTLFQPKQPRRGAQCSKYQNCPLTGPLPYTISLFWHVRKCNAFTWENIFCACFSELTSLLYENSEKISRQKKNESQVKLRFLHGYDARQLMKLVVLSLCMSVIMSDVVYEMHPHNVALYYRCQGSPTLTHRCSDRAAPSTHSGVLILDQRRNVTRSEHQIRTGFPSEPPQVLRCSKSTNYNNAINIT